VLISVHRNMSKRALYSVDYAVMRTRGPPSAKQVAEDVPPVSLETSATRAYKALKAEIDKIQMDATDAESRRHNGHIIKNIRLIAGYWEHIMKVE
jgi:hypothetical protein